MLPQKLPQNSSTEEGEHWYRKQNPQSRISSSNRARKHSKPGETLNSRKFITRNPNQWQRRDRTIGETSRTDRIPDKIPIEDQDESDGDDDWMCRDDEYDSDDLSLETAKKSRWLRDFFGWLDSLSKDQIDDPTMRMHCPACRDGVGAVMWYRGFQSVLTHAKNVRSKRVRLHRRFAKILDGEMRDRRLRFSVSNQGDLLEAKGLRDEVEVEVEDRMIVWPPMVIVQNTRSHRDENGKWVGVGNLELRSCFKHYNISKVKSAYGPGGHSGVSLFLFEGSAVGYVEAEGLHRQFLKEGRGKYEWENHRGRAQSAGEHLLYGYMATEGDMELFNKHSKGKQKHRFEMKSYKIMVVNASKKMEDNDHKMIGLEKKVSCETEENKILMGTCDDISQKLYVGELEIQTIRQRASEELGESKKEIGCLDNYGAAIKQLTNSLEKIKIEQGEMQKPFHTMPNSCNEPRPVI